MADQSRLDEALEQFEQALRQLEAAWAQARESETSAASLRGEAEALREDRSRLAGELDAVMARAGELTEAGRQAARRVEMAMSRIRAVLGETAADGA